MSKRSDDDATEFDDGLSTSERRRRRRRGGIRIPSDNVPRRTDSQPVVAPIPEDPSLAVSIAYAFGDDAGRAPTTLPPDEIVADLDDATAIGGVPSADGAVPGAIDDVVPDGRTRQMPAVNLEALGLTALEFEESPPSVEPTAETPIVDPTRTTGEVEAVDIIVDDAGVADGVPKAPMARAATVALSEDDLEELMESTAFGVAPARAKPTTAPPVPPPIERTRQTAPPMPAALPATAAAAPPATSPPVVVSFSTPAPVAPVAPVASAAPVATPPEASPATAAPAAAADAGDSSEILADEILEVEEQGRAPAVEVSPVPVPIAAQPSGPVALPPTAPPPPPAAAPKPPPPAPAAPAARKPMAAAPAADDKRKRRGKPWFEDLFDEDYLRTLPFLTPQTTQAEAAMVVESLGLTPGAQVLDLGCGYGRHAMELAARGMNMVGVDLSLPMLLRGADEAQRRGLDINFVHVDMREIDFDAQFDGAYCLFSTFGFFDDETNKKTASLVAKALKPGAKFMLEVLNRDYVIGDLPTRVWWEGDGCVVLEEVEFNYFSSRVQSKRSVVFDDGRQIEQEISIRVYSLHEIGKLLHAAGLRVLEVSGSMATKGRFLGNRSREIIVIAERRTDTK
ncbi:MAG: methyltransferase domain-containing protein [Myxococcales bacterium]|nr:methyltransferase domain-containing protein [Myxococcales bacterium]MBK7194555.1 methyltransferase domain-containing protein [Myxococcales bacterium]MBP6845192.1 methyltransferase domain-containing protein [Kofleriaceae bacterium]